MVPSVEKLYTSPTSRHVFKEGERSRSVTVGEASAITAYGDVKTVVDSVDVSDIDVLIIHVVGVIEISDIPVLISSRTVLEFHENGCLRCKVSASSNYCVLADSAELIGIRSHHPERVAIDGNGCNIVGIYLGNMSSCHIDGMMIQNCTAGGIVIESVTDTGHESFGSITRCTVSNCSQGISVSSSVPFLLVDNSIIGNCVLGLLLQGSTGCIVAGNTFDGNISDIFVNLKTSVIYKNSFKTTVSSVPLVQLAATSSGVLIFENDFVSLLDVSIETSFTSSVIVGCSSSAEAQPIFSSTFDCISLCRRLSCTSELLSFQIDVYVWGSTDESSPADVTAIGNAMRAARALCGENILVVRAEGHFVSYSPEGLLIPPDTCLLLSGSISAEACTCPSEEASRRPSQLILLAQSGFVAIVGGTLNCRGIVDHAVSALGTIRKSPVKNSDMVLLDSVEMVDSKKDGVYLKARCPSIPFIVFRCFVRNSGSRGIWIHVASLIYVLNSVFRGNKKDGIDFDAGCKNCVAVGNTCTENMRHGIFIEEGARDLIIVKNECFKNVWSGIHVWNEAVSGCTSSNVIAMNKCSSNTKGIAVGGRSSDKTVKNNCLFNNVCAFNSAEGIISGNAFSENNGFVHNVIDSNQSPLQVKQWGQNVNIHFSFPVL
jgi:parallel beta-helix repeat protein